MQKYMHFLLIFELYILGDALIFIIASPFTITVFLVLNTEGA